MKSNAFVSKITKAFVMLAVFTTPAFAQGDSQDPDEVDVSDRSAIGQELGLELYDRDKSDYCVPGALQIRVNVHNVSKQGILKLELFGKRKFLKKEGKLRRIRVPAEDKSQQVCINLPAPGEYAVVGYHDIDGNRRLKKAWNLKPKEPYGLSNNPDIKTLRLPKFSETSVAVPMEGVDIDIHLVDLSK